MLHQKHFLLFSRLFVGLLFIFSGLIKLNDPLGFSYKLEEYFEVFHVVFLNPILIGSERLFINRSPFTSARSFTISRMRLRKKANEQ